MSTEHLTGIVQLIFHRIKTGTQWRELPIKQYLSGDYSGDYSWQSVYHHRPATRFNRWTKDGSWKRLWLHHLGNKKHLLDLSTAQLDGTHTPCKRGGQATGYQGRKACVTSNMLCLSDNQGILVAASQPEEGQHHDSFDIENHLEELIGMLQGAGIETNGLFLNADAAFDTEKARKVCIHHGLIPNFDLNPRNGSKWNRDVYFDELLYQRRKVIERAFAWLDAYKALLIRYETSARNWLSLNLIGFTVCFIRKT